MATNTGYDFYIDGLKLPFAPPSLEIKVNGRNETVTLINQGDINILKSPGLTEISFEMRLPQQQYPFAGELYPVSTYTDKLKELMEEKKSFQFIVVRTLPNGTSLFDTDLTVAVEEWTMKEDADEGFDVLIDVTLKQWVDYGVKTVEIQETGYSNSANRDTGTKGTANSNYTVVKGDCLWNIAKKYYGDGRKWTLIYEANKASIEATAKKYGKSSSSNGHWIYPGQKLIIPGITTGTGSNKSGSSKSTSNGASNSRSSERKEVTPTYSTSKHSLTIRQSPTGKDYSGYIRVTTTEGTKQYEGNATITVPKGSRVTVAAVAGYGHSCKISASGFTQYSDSRTYFITMNKNAQFAVAWID